MVVLQFRRNLRLLILLFTAHVSQAAVTVSQDTVTLKTWSEGLPDTNPWFELFPSSNYPVYPYTMRTSFSTATSSVAWRELVLENEYLRCRVFPDLGGHLYSCLDKIDNVEIFYANPVIRKAWVGLRGAWVALGIELNFPVGHSLVSVSPVSFGTQQNPDGSAGAWVADIDRQTGMEWRVEFVLRPGSAMLEQDVSLYNRGDSRQPYYWWSTSEETEQDGNDTFILPTHLSGTHGFTILDTWPVNQAAVDMSVIKNYTAALGLFAYGSNEPFFAAYHPATKTGTAHYADPAIMPGKKIWTWSLSGDPWVTSNLTENFPSYVETQGGVTPNQETRLWLDPQQTSHFTEYWMPARELDGISRANTAGVLYLGRAMVNGQPALVVEFNANRAIAGATVRILNGSSPAAQDSIVNLDPAVTYRQTVSGVASNVNYTFQLLDSASNVLMTHTENQYSGLTAADVTLGSQPPTYFGPAGSEQYYLGSTAYNEQLQQYFFAEHDYNVGLALYPMSIGLRKGLARLEFLDTRYDDAATLLAQVTAQTPNDDEAHFYLGLAYAALGRNNAAASEWTGIQATADFGPAATFELACLRALTGDLATAASLLDTVITVRAGAMEAAVLRRQGNTAGASAKLAQWRSMSPTDLFLRYEATLLGTPDSALLNDLGAEPERVLNLADDYLRLGSYGDALALLNQIYPTNLPSNQQEPGAVAPQNNPLIAYYRGYCRQQLGGSPNADFAAASAMALPYIFPSRTSSFAVLRTAIDVNSNDATAHDLLGLLYMSRREADNAIAEWQTARSLNKTLPTLHRNLGRAYLDVKGDINSALPVLSEGLNYEPSNSDLQDAYNRANAAKQANTSCPFTLTNPASGSVSIGSGATSLSVGFTGSASCNWSLAGYGGGWIATASASQGQGPGTATYAVNTNTSLTSRTQTLFVAGQPFTITQAGASCSYTLTSSSASTPTSGGPVTVGVTSPSDACVWTATTTQPWLSITSGASGDGGTVTISVAPNAGSARSGMVTIAGHVFTVNQAGTATSDLALGKPATESSTLAGYGPAGASNAVDGNTDGNFGDGSVSHTNQDAHAWWQVDLGASAAIGSIAIWNRTDCCSNRLSDYWVFVSDTAFGPTDTPMTLQTRAGTWNSHQTTIPNPSTTITVNAQGRYVRVQLSGTDYLSLGEVQVFGSSGTTTYGISGQVTLSGTGLNGVSVALSGTQSGSASTTASGSYSFTSLAAAGAYTVTPSLSGYSFTPPSQIYNNLSANQTANFIAAAATNNDLALGKAATESSTLAGYGPAGASNAVDGNTDGSFANGSVSHTNQDANAWWQVDLGNSAAVTSIAIWNRTDCCMDRLGDYWVFVSNTPLGASDTPAALQGRAGTWSSHQTAYPNPSTTIPANAQGRYVRVQLSGTNYLSLAEVQVFGTFGAATCGVSGQVTLSGAGQSGVTVTLSGSQSGSVNTNASGNYAFSGLAAAGNYTVTPSLSGYNFSPPSQTFNNLSANQTANFTATPVTYQISGQVTLSGAGLNGVNVTLSGAQSGSVNTSASGNYTFSGLAAAGNYTVTPSLSGYNFSPPTQTFNNLNANQTANFTATAVTYQISGQVTLSGAGLNGVSLALSGSQSESMNASGSGNYSFTGLTATGNYTVTPSLSGYNFSPPSQTFSNLSANQTANFTASAITSNDLALGKVATESSTLAGYGPAGASNAVDGNTDGNFAHGSVSHTNLDANAWWQVDLGAAASIGSITIWNRTDCCGDRLSDYWVFVSNTPFGPTDTPAALQARGGTWSSHQTSYPNPSTTMAVSAQGRYVRVQLSGSNYLNLAEVQVFGSGTTTYGISGQVTLSGAGLNGVTVMLSGSQSGSLSTSGTGNYSFASLAAAGAYTVTPSLSGYSFTPPSQTFSNLRANQTASFTASAVTSSNLALGKAATQSSTLAGYGPTTVASSAIDGNTDGKFSDGSVSHTNSDANAWWQVDLGTAASVSSVAIWNRTDCCSDRLSDYWVFVSNTPFGPTDTPATLQGRAGTWSSHQTAFPNPSTTISVNSQGRYVRVQLSGGNYLNLAEVQAFGTNGTAMAIK